MASDTPAELEDYIARIVLRDRAAFEQLYSATSAKLFGVCLRVLNNRAEAEEVLQDCFVKVWNNSDRYAVNGYSPITWLVTIARNTAIDRLRTRKDSGADIDDMPELPDRGPTPEAAAIASSEARRINGCLAELDDQKAGAVRGAYLEGESYADLAARFDVPVNTMRTWLRRSLVALKECLSR